MQMGFDKDVFFPKADPISYRKLNGAYEPVNGILSDLSDEFSRRRTEDGQGTSVTWEVGHLLRYRCRSEDRRRLEGHRVSGSRLLGLRGEVHATEEGLEAGVGAEALPPAT